MTDFFNSNVYPSTNNNSIRDDKKPIFLSSDKFNYVKETIINNSPKKFSNSGKKNRFNNININKLPQKDAYNSKMTSILQDNVLQKNNIHDNPNIYYNNNNNNNILLDTNTPPLASNASTTDDMLLNGDHKFSFDDNISYENPILDEVYSKTINKEFYFQSIVLNFIILLILPLIINFSTFFIQHTKLGHKLFLLPKDFTNITINYNNKINFSFNIRYDINYKKISSFFKIFLWSKNFYLFYKIFIQYYNFNYLNLNNNQSHLLGLLNDNNNNNLKEKSRINKDKKYRRKNNNNNNNSNNNIINSSTVSPSNSFIFKNLKSPMKQNNNVQSYDNNSNINTNTSIKQQQFPLNSFTSNFQNNNNNNNNPLNSFFNPISTTTPPPTTNNNILGDSNANNYIPSSKYNYMINTPSHNDRKNWYMT